MIGIEDIRFFLPEKQISNETLYQKFDLHPGFLETKLGVKTRYICDETESVSDLGFRAAETLFKETDLSPGQVGLLLVCTQNPDYPLPTTACLLQDRLGIKDTCPAFDINLGCSGFVYSLAVAKSMMEVLHISDALIITAEAYSKVVSPDDYTVSTLFSDGAAAVWLKKDGVRNIIGNFEFGTDGSGYDNLIVPAGGSRNPITRPEQLVCKEAGKNISRSERHLIMDGREIFNFVCRRVASCITEFLRANGLSAADIDIFLFHQPNDHMLKALAKRIDAPLEKVIFDSEWGNTVSATIPIAWAKNLALDPMFGKNKRILLCGFGVGLSWASCLING